MPLPQPPKHKHPVPPPRAPEPDEAQVLRAVVGAVCLHALLTHPTRDPDPEATVDLALDYADRLLKRVPLT